MTSPRLDVHDVISKVIQATSNIISESGMGAATVRAICDRSGVLAPKVYQTFGNVAQLLNTVAVYQWRMHALTERESDAPVSNLYSAIETLVTFGLEHSELYLHATTPQDSGVSELWSSQQNYLAERVHAVARTGRLRVGEEQAIALLQPFSVGVVCTCIQQTSRLSDLDWLSLQVIRPLLRSEEPGQEAEQNACAFASGLKANLGTVSVLSHGEHSLLGELLERIAQSK